MITEKNINKLFNYLWPDMYDVHNHRSNCLNNLSPINNYFIKFHNDHNKLFNGLCSLEGIGLTISSGLIWTAFPTRRVPFDKWTLTYAIQKEILISNIISDDYISACEKIRKFCKQSSKLNIRTYTIKDFVREALVELKYLEYPLIEPK